MRLNRIMRAIAKVELEAITKATQKNDAEPGDGHADEDDSDRVPLPVGSNSRL